MYLKYRYIYGNPLELVKIQLILPELPLYSRPIILWYAYRKCHSGKTSCIYINSRVFR